MINYIKNIIIIPIILLIITLSSAKVLADEILLDRIAAIVNNEIITLYQLNEALKPYEEKIKEAKENQRDIMRSEARKGILNRLIERKLTEQEAVRLKLSINDSELDKSIGEFKKNNKMTDEDLKNFLKKEGITIKEYREQIRDYMLSNRLINYQVKSKVVITKEAIAAYYKDHIDQYTKKKMYYLYNIFMSVENSSDYMGRELKLQKIMEVIAKIKKGESFTKMAAKYSEAPNSSSGGDLGEVDSSAMLEPIQEALAQTKIGETTPLIETDQGFQIYYIKNIQEKEGQTLEEATPSIEEELYKGNVGGKFNTWMNELKQKSYIKIMIND